MSMSRLSVVFLSTILLSACAGNQPTDQAAIKNKEKAEKTKTNDKCRATIGSRVGRRCN